MFSIPNWILDKIVFAYCWVKCFVVSRGEFREVAENARDSKKHLAQLGKGVLWMHGASVGEQICLLGVLRELVKASAMPSQVVLSYTSPDGLRAAKNIQRELNGHSIVTVPLLLCGFGICRTVFRDCVHALVVAEGELWPRFWLTVPKSVFKLLIDARFRPSIGVHSRFSKAVRSFQYKRIGKFFDKITVCSGTVAAEACKHVDSSKIICTGASKADVAIATAGDVEIQRTNWLHRLGISESTQVAVFASVRNDELDLIATTTGEVMRALPELTIIIAPRHVRKAWVVPKLIELLRQAGLTSVRLVGKPETTESQLIIVDSVGELPAMLSIAGLTIVCGSFNKGAPGHSIIEPAALGCPIIVGPYRRNWEPVYEKFATSAGLRVVDRDSLALQIISYFERSLVIDGDANQTRLRELSGASLSHARLLMSRY